MDKLGGASPQEVIDLCLLVQRLGEQFVPEVELRDDVTTRACVVGLNLIYVYEDGRSGPESQAGFISLSLISLEHDWTVRLWLHDRPHYRENEVWVQVGSYEWVFSDAAVKNVEAWRRDMTLLKMFEPWKT